MNPYQNSIKRDEGRSASAKKNNKTRKWSFEKPWAQKKVINHRKKTRQMESNKQK